MINTTEIQRKVIGEFKAQEHNTKLWELMFTLLFQPAKLQSELEPVPDSPA